MWLAGFPAAAVEKATHAALQPTPTISSPAKRTALPQQVQIACAGPVVEKFCPCPCYAQIINISPCAMLITRISPKVTASPSAASSSTLPRLSP